MKVHREEDRMLLVKLADTMSQLDKIISTSLKMYKWVRSPVRMFLETKGSDAETSSEDESEVVHAND